MIRINRFLKNPRLRSLAGQGSVRLLRTRHAQPEEVTEQINLETGFYEPVQKPSAEFQLDSLINIKPMGEVVASSASTRTHRKDSYHGTKIARVDVGTRNKVDHIQKLARIDSKGQEVTHAADRKSVDNFIMEASTGDINKRLRNIPKDIMDEARQQVVLEMKTEAILKHRELKRKRAIQGMVVKPDETGEKQVERVNIISAYNAVLKKLEEDKEQVEEFNARRGRANDDKFIRNYYAKTRDTYLKKLTDQELVVRLHQEMIYADSDFMVFNKPYGLLSTHDDKRRSVEAYANDVKRIIYGPTVDLGTHQGYLPYRLPKHITGCLVVSKNRGAVNDTLIQMSARQLLQRVYLAIVIGKPAQSEGQIDIRIGSQKTQMYTMDRHIERPTLKLGSNFGVRAVTYYKVIAYSPDTNVSLLQVQPLTGVADQMNVHLADALGTPILGDHKFCGDFKARGGLGLPYIKSWYRQSYSQPLPNRVYKKLGFSRVEHTAQMPLHLHLARVSIPGMAADRQSFSNKAIKDHFEHLNQKLSTGEISHQEFASNPFEMNTGSDLICQAQLPDFWTESLSRLGLLNRHDILDRMKPPQPTMVQHMAARKLQKSRQVSLSLDHDDQISNQEEKMTWYVGNTTEKFKDKLTMSLKPNNTQKLAKGMKKGNIFNTGHL